MAAEMWALVGLLGVCLGILATALFLAISRIDALRADMNSRFDRVDDRFGRVDAAIANLDRRLTIAGG